MSAPEGKRVFILGAGFSKAAGMPDAHEVATLLLESDLLRHHKELQAWARDLLERIQHVNRLDCTGGGVSVNVEQLFEYAAFDRELYLVRQHLCPFGRYAGPSPHQKAESIDHWLSYMERDLVKVLISRQQAARPEALHDFAGSLRPGDTIVTFNYDTLLESTLTGRRLHWSHGFEAESPGDVRIFKLHGSIDWWMLQRGTGVNASKWTKLFEKYDEDESHDASEGLRARDEWEYHAVLYRAADLNIARLAYERESAPIFDPVPRRGLAGLGPYKPLHRLVGSGEVWLKAFDAIREADEIYVIGWSASPYDTMARFHFASVLNLPECKPKRVVVVDPKVGEQIKNYRSIFGEVEAIPQCAEHVDWDSVLARQ